MGLFPNNHSKVNMPPHKEYFTKTSNAGTAPYFQNYYPFSSYLDGPLDSYNGSSRKKGPKILSWLAGITLGVVGAKFLMKNKSSITGFFKGLIGK